MANSKTTAKLHIDFRAKLHIFATQLHTQDFLFSSLNSDINQTLYTKCLRT